MSKLFSKIIVASISCVLFWCSLVAHASQNPPYKIFQIGFNKCGTTTLYDFFIANDINSIHWHNSIALKLYKNHMFAKPLLAGEDDKGIVGFFDLTSVQGAEPIDIGFLLYQELDRQYPGSKFILNIRRKEDWLLSRCNHKTKYNSDLLQRVAKQYGMSTAKTYALWSEHWDSHIKGVLEYFKDRPNDLLIFDIDNDSPQKIADFFAPDLQFDIKKYAHKHITTRKRTKGFNFVDKVYCINLLQSIERREHMQTEFSRLNIQNYEFIQAVDKDSPIVKNLMASYKVKKFPPCFRCHKLFCKCSNNHLIPAQIGNWMSFITVFTNMLQNNVHYAIITEDDIKFTPEAEAILNELINYKSFAANDIDLNKPLLIRLHGRYDPASRDLNNIHFNKEVTLSNPCFLVNKLFAEYFLKRLNIIETTSDIYIHVQLPKQNKDIQSLAVYPKPVYQLSTGIAESGVEAVFASTIRHNNTAANDYEHSKRVDYWDYFIKRLTFKK